MNGKLRTNVPLLNSSEVKYPYLIFTPIHSFSSVQEKPASAFRSAIVVDWLIEETRFQSQNPYTTYLFNLEKTCIYG
jgi:hypothetical protein